jgi:chromosomal replication initiation ATPase DnaA
MKYFIDTEFIEGFHKPMFGKNRHFIDLISIGIVCEDGRTYYAISNEFNPKDADKWVKENVIDKIEVWLFQQQNTFAKSHFNFGLKELLKQFGKSNKQIAKEVEQFCKPNETKAVNAGIDAIIGNIDPNIEFYGYYADYDWVLFCSLYGRMIDLPKGFPMYCKDLKQMFDEVANTYTSEQLSKIEYPTVTHNVLEFLGNNGTLNKPEHLKKHKDYPKQENEHSALDDAKWNVKLFEFVQKCRV